MNETSTTADSISKGVGRTISETSTTADLFKEILEEQ